MNIRGAFGKELTFDAQVDKEHINDKEHIEAWLRDLIKDVRMEIHKIDGEEAIHIDTWAAQNMPFTFGTSCCILISTSSISLHTAIDEHDETRGKIYLNLFSCSDFNYDEVIANVKKHWKGVEVTRWMLIDR